MSAAGGQRSAPWTRRCTNDHLMIGLVGRVTGEVGPGTLGEVVILIRGGIESFYAKPVDGTEVIHRGRSCVVVDYHAQEQRTVYVTALPDNP